MAIKTYSVTLKEEVVTECQSYYKDSGGKLSPLLNKLLEDWLALQKKKKVKPEPVKQENKSNKDLLGSDIDLLGDEVIN